jgi:hypothetical protein
MNASAIIIDLPLVMVTIAQRMHHQSLRSRNGVPKDLPSLTLRTPMNRSRTNPTPEHNLEVLQRADAPFVVHPDPHELYEFLCSRIEDLEGIAGDALGRCGHWESLARDRHFGLVREELADADGGVNETKWWAYVRCVIKALCVWQAYCERARKLLARRTDPHLAGIGRWAE